MKKLILFVCAIATTVAVNAQLKTPAPSPSQEIKQTVGLTDVKVEYSRPSVKGRIIFGDLVPYNKMWRTGANANTKITFSNDVIIGGNTVKAGSYALYTKPGPQNWDIMLYSDTNNWGTPENWDDSKVAATVTAPVYPMPMNIETFTISFDDVTSNSANLGLMWEKSYVALPIKFMTDKMVSANIEQVMAGPGANDYYQAAVYYLESGQDITKAKQWIDTAIEMREDPAFWYHRQQALIYAKAGDKKGAIDAAKKSLALAKAANNDDYVALNTKSLKEWGAM
jgi:Protein of unknown function (DUF2911)